MGISGTGKGRRHHSSRKNYNGGNGLFLGFKFSNWIISGIYAILFAVLLLLAARS